MQKILLFFFLQLTLSFYVYSFNISGIAIDAESEDGLPGIELTLFTEGGLVKSAITENDGSFIFTNVPDGSHDLEFHYYEPIIINGTYYLRTLYEDPIIVDGGDVTNIIFNINPHHPDFHVSGILYNASTNQPIIDQNLSLRLDFISHSGFFFAWADNEGSYSFEDFIPDWTYTFNVFENEYYYGDQIELTIEPDGPEDIEINFYLQPKDGISVSGSLFDIDTYDPIMLSNRTVRISAVYPYWAETNELGEFTFVNVEPGYYANITVTSEDTSYIICNESTIYDFVVPEDGIEGVELFQKKFETTHIVTADDRSFIPGETKTIRFSLVQDDLIYGEIWGVELNLSNNITTLSTSPFLRYYNNSQVFERKMACSNESRLVWEGYHNVYGQGNVGNLGALNDSVYADVEFQFDNNTLSNAEIFYEVFYSYACNWQPFSFGTIEIVNETVTGGIENNVITNDQMSCWPNPAYNDRTTVILTLDKNEYGQIVLYDLTGQLIYQLDSEYFKMGINKIPIDLNALSEGIYFFTFTSENHVLSEKLIKSN